jgi:2-methylisocitrate lyase-like PEP mutase family enzyme/putative methionine-R-sulfoxide reductase with GAF domain
VSDLLNSLQEILTSRASRSEKAKQVAATIRTAGGYRWVGLYDVGPDQIGVVGWDGPAAPTYPTFPITQGLNGAAVASGQPVIVQDISRDARYLTTLSSTRAEMIMPVRASGDGAVLGTIDVESDQVNPFTERDRELLSTCAGALAGLWSRSADRCRVFRQLHQSGCFVIPNPWDVGSARLLAGLGFRALATTSSGFAWSLGRRDNHVSLEEALAHLRSVAQAVEVPVNADFEGGFATEPDQVGRNVATAAATGIAGLSIEDSTGDTSNPLFDFALSVERIQAAREALDQSGADIVLTGRSEGFIVGRPDLKETIRRLAAYADAGADCLYAPGIRTQQEIAAVVAAVAPKPVNVLVGSNFATVAELARAGVRRISTGGALARAAWTGFLESAKEIAERGTFTQLGRAVPFAEINEAFGRR